MGYLEETLKFKVYMNLTLEYHICIGKRKPNILVLKYGILTLQNNLQNEKVYDTHNSYETRVSLVVCILFPI